MQSRELPTWNRVRLTSTLEPGEGIVKSLRSACRAGESHLVGARWIMHAPYQFLLSGIIGIGTKDDVHSVHLELSAIRFPSGPPSEADEADESDETFMEYFQKLAIRSECRLSVSYPVSRPKDYVIPLPMPVTEFGAEGFSELRGVRLAKIGADGNEEYSAILDGGASAGLATINFPLDTEIGLDAFLQAAEKADRLLRLALPVGGRSS